MTSLSQIPRPGRLIHGANPVSRNRHRQGLSPSSNPSVGASPQSPPARQGLLPRLGARAPGSSRAAPGLAAMPRTHSTPTCPFSSNSPLRSMLAVGPPLRGRPRRAPSWSPDSNPWAPAAANPSASRRGQTGDPLVPGSQAPQGHGEPEPRAQGTGAH